jgi:DNA-binding transcriptional LysR family regulator
VGVSPNITVEHLRVLAAIAEHGSFTAAARGLRRTQGAISHSVATLEEQLDLKLFERTARRPVMTEQGHAILREGAAVLERLAELHGLAAVLSQGLEPSVSAVIDTLYPTRQLVEIVREFESAFPNVRLVLQTGVLAQVVERVRSGQSQLGVTGVTALPTDLVVGACCTVKLVAVASTECPLARVKGPVSDRLLREHTNILLTDDVDASTASDKFVGRKVWRVGDSHVRYSLIRAGLGWARLPMDLVIEDLRQGRLVRLTTKRWPQPTPIPLHTIHRSDRAPGRAGQWLVERLCQTAN